MLEKDRTDSVAVLEEVFDNKTLMLIYKLFNKGIIDQIFGVVKSGKESRIYRGHDLKGENIAIKIYLTTSKEFRRGMLPYIEGDPRFKYVKRDTHSLIYAWAQKEFKNLKRAYKCGVRVPKPIYVEKNVLVMEFIGEEDLAAPTLKEQPPEYPKKTYEKILEYVKILYRQAKLIHGDLSEYNIMNVADEPVLFDVSQTVTSDHPKAKEY
jgi:RIO kinase 1